MLYLCLTAKPPPGSLMRPHNTAVSMAALLLGQAAPAARSVSPAPLQQLLVALLEGVLRWRTYAKRGCTLGAYKN